MWLEAVDFPVLLTKEFFTNEDGSVGVRHLVTSDLTLTFDHIINLYQRRWSIEVYHKSLKQNASLEKSPARTETTRAQSPVCESVCSRQVRKFEVDDRGWSLYDVGLTHLNS